eukprot:6199044-Pleurochrysis_carterae.AAC.2
MAATVIRPVHADTELGLLLADPDSQNLRHSAKATHSALRRWGEWQRDGPIYASLSIQILIYYLVDSGETPL